VNRAARASRPCGIDPSRKSRSCPRRGGNEKPDLYAVATCTKVRPYLTLPRYLTAAKDASYPLGEVSLCVRVATRRRQSLSRGYDYFFFFEVFFATFLVAAFAVFFAFFAFLAMWSSVKNWLSEHAHAVYRHAQHSDDITNTKLIPTSREVALESLAGGSRSRLRRRYADAPAAALLTGLATREWSPLALRPYASFLY
jgi:hypothetical protein